ncbi:MAG: ATP-dependent DNA helicase RecG [Rikenellaceae bacterium]|jgi:ATP-dependent DNA helicase RecG|nr:ATP-dependent DNA helicase RecG [Rikenellaceae bacterium]
MSPLDNDIKFLAGVDERRATLLGKELGVHTLRDLLYHFPRRYIDRSKIYRIGDIRDDGVAWVQFRARIDGLSILGAGHKKRLVAEVSDGSGHAQLVWFQGVDWMMKRLERGREYIVFGKPTIFNGELDIVHPEIESTLAAQEKPGGGMQGVYGSTEKLGAVQLGAKGIYALVCNLWRDFGKFVEEGLPEWFVKANRLMPLREALYNIHFPQSEQMLKAARYRLKFEELLGVQLDVLSHRSGRMARGDGFVMGRVGELFNGFFNERLPFELTGAQKRVVKEIRRDMVSGCQMNRLLQGDVGSGKTLVALMASLLAADNGFQSCLMAPTEILARQHYASVSGMTEGLGFRVAVLTGATRKRERDRILAQLEQGEIDLLIGTHALLEQRVAFANLGFVTIDEQHRFGVEQRARLWTKNRSRPHILVMTATPIPRTLAMTLYGDLDASAIDELPPGRKPIKTIHFREAERLRVFGAMRREIKLGRQAYVVYPLIRESEKMDYQNLYDGFEYISQEFPLPEYHVVALHGKMSGDDKTEVMRMFKEGVAHILVATSVIEVGVDVPNASVMVIESAERFGLSQLHQLRGRVGRGAEQSYCILMSGDKLSREARSRLEAMVETNDGFRLAELDLKLRGAGDITGTQQSGMAIDLKIADLGQDGRIVEAARAAAMGILEADPLLASPENLLLRQLRERYSNRTEEIDFSQIS